jgi:hypothetical protein
VRERFHKIRIPQHTHRLVRELFEKANDEMISAIDLSERSGINRNTLKDWRTRTVPTIANLDAVGNVLGWELTWRRMR